MMRSHSLKEIVALLQLVPEKQIVLTQLKLLDVKLSHDPIPKHIGCGKQPTSSRLFLIRDWAWVLVSSRETFEGGVENMSVRNEGRTRDKARGRMGSR